MKKIVQLLILSFFSFNLFAQPRSSETLPNNESNGSKGKVLAAASVSSSPDTTYLSPASFRKKVKLIFGQIVTGQSTASALTNYADADIANGKLAFSGTQFFGDRLFLSVGANAKVDNNISQIFDGFKLSSNVSADIRLNFRIKNVFWYDPSDAIELRRKKQALLAANINANSKLSYDSIFTVAFINQQSLRIENNRRQLVQLRNQINNLYLPDNRSIDTARNLLEGDETTKARTERIIRLNIDSMKIDYFRLIQDSLLLRAGMDSAVYIHNHTGSTKQLIKVNNKELAKRIEAVEMEASFKSLHMVWASVRYNPSRQKFYLYDSLQAFKSQVKDSSFNTAFFGAELNYYYWSQSRGMSVYANLGWGWQQENNLDTLKSYDVTEERARVEGADSRKVSNKYNAYSGKYGEFKSRKLYANLYVFSGSNNAAIHLFPEFKFWDDGPTVFNLGIGFVMSFKSRKDEKTIINAEPFIQWKDMANKLNSDKGVFSRNMIGLRIGLPINPVQPK
jgi:hypothetical protein